MVINTRMATQTPAKADYYLDLLNALDANVWVSDAATLQRSFVTSYAGTCLGYPLEEWLKPGFWQGIVHPEDRPRAVADAMKRPLKENAFTMEYRLMTKTQGVVWVRDAISVVRDPAGKPRELRGIMRDESMLHDAMETLRKTEQRLRIMFESAKDYAIFSMDLDGVVTSWNPGAENIFGYQPHEIVGKSARVLFTPEDRAHGDDTEEIRRALLVGRAVNERWHVHKGGRRLWGSGLMMPVRDEGGRDVAVMKIMRDATEQRRLSEEVRRLNSELELRVAERTAQLETANRELDSFSYSVSHDLQSPLRKIDGYSRLLLHEHAERLGDGARAYCEKILDSTQGMSRLIDALLNLARVVRGTMRREPVNLSELARESIEELARMHPERKVEFKGKDDLVVLGDRQLLGIALYNLLDNAWKFTGKSRHPAIEFGTRGGAPPVYFVRDNGAGFDMNYAGKLFREFSRLHDPKDYRGTGIGLATVQRIVRRHGGEVWAESKPEEGATFYFTLGSDA